MEEEMARALSDKSRLEILKMLRDGGAMDVNSLVSRLGKHRSTVNRHLRVLMDAGLVMRAEGEAGYVYMLANSAKALLNEMRRGSALIEIPVRRMKVCGMRAKTIFKILITRVPPVMLVIIGFWGAIIGRDVGVLARMIWLMMFLVSAYIVHKVIASLAH